MNFAEENITILKKQRKQEKRRKVFGLFSSEVRTGKKLL